MEVRIGVAEKAHVVIHTLAERVDASEFFPVAVEIRAGGFSGTFTAAFQVHDFVVFRDATRVLYGNLNGRAKFQTIEDQLELEMIGDGIGHFAVRGVARDHAGRGNQLHFHFDIDQTEVPPIVRALDRLCEMLSDRSTD